MLITTFVSLKQDLSWRKNPFKSNCNAYFSAYCPMMCTAKCLKCPIDADIKAADGQI